jgi:hypothetical protein
MGDDNRERYRIPVPDIAAYALIPARYFGHLAALALPQGLFDYLPFVW